MEFCIFFKTDNRARAINLRMKPASPCHFVVKFLAFSFRTAGTKLRKRNHSCNSPFSMHLRVDYQTSKDGGRVTTCHTSNYVAMKYFKCTNMKKCNFIVKNISAHPQLSISKTQYKSIKFIVTKFVLFYLFPIKISGG